MPDAAKRRDADRAQCAHLTESGSDVRRRVLVISGIGFVREGLALVLSQDGGFDVLGLAAGREETAGLLDAGRAPEIVLLDAGLPQGRDLAELLRHRLADARIVVFCVDETEEEVIAWAEAGASAYLSRSTSLRDVVDLLHRIGRGEQPCSAQVASGLLRRLARRPQAAAAAEAAGSPDAVLTSRESEVAKFIVAGLSNKEIARRLLVGVPTVKSHVHNIFGKLQLARRSQLAWRLGTREGAWTSWPPSRG